MAQSAMELRAHCRRNAGAGKRGRVPLVVSGTISCALRSSASVMSACRWRRRSATITRRWASRARCGRGSRRTSACPCWSAPRGPPPARRRRRPWIVSRCIQECEPEGATFRKRVPPSPWKPGPVIDLTRAAVSLPMFSPRRYPRSIRENLGIELNMHAHEHKKTLFYQGLQVPIGIFGKLRELWDGSGGGTRTPDPWIMIPLLYRLSYPAPRSRRQAEGAPLYAPPSPPVKHTARRTPGVPHCAALRGAVSGRGANRGCRRPCRGR